MPEYQNQQDIEKYKQAWKLASEEVKEEFLQDEDSYVAFKIAAANGQVRIMGKKNVQ